MDANEVEILHTSDTNVDNFAVGTQAELVRMLTNAQELTLCLPDGSTRTLTAYRLPTGKLVCVPKRPARPAAPAAPPASSRPSAGAASVVALQEALRKPALK